MVFPDDKTRIESGKEVSTMAHTQKCSERRPGKAAGVKQSRKNGSDILWQLSTTLR